MRDRRGGLLEDPLLDLLLLLQGLDEGCLQSIGVLGLQGLLLIGGHALLAHDGTALLLTPAAGEVGLALSACERLRGNRSLRTSLFN